MSAELQPAPHSRSRAAALTFGVFAAVTLCAIVVAARHRSGAELFEAGCFIAFVLPCLIGLCARTDVDERSTSAIEQAEVIQCRRSQWATVYGSFHHAKLINIAILCSISIAATWAFLTGLTLAAQIAMTVFLITCALEPIRTEFEAMALTRAICNRVEARIAAGSAYTLISRSLVFPGDQVAVDDEFFSVLDVGEGYVSIFHSEYGPTRVRSEDISHFSLAFDYGDWR